MGLLRKENLEPASCILIYVIREKSALEGLF